MRRTLAAMVLAGTLVACAGAGRPELSDETLPDRACSADGMVVEPFESDGLPSEVALRRQELVDAALSCDFRGLRRMAQQDGLEISIDGERLPVTRWQELEEEGLSILRPLAGLLALAYVRQDDEEGRRFTWPTAVDWPFADVTDGQERAALVEVVTEEGIYGWGEAGGYSGWRTSISADGRWERFRLGTVDGEYD